MDAPSLLRLHLETVFIADDHGRLVSVNDGSGLPAPRFFMGWTAEGNVWAFRRGLPAALTERLTAAAEAEPPDLDVGPNSDRLTRYRDLLSAHQPVQRMWTGPTYRFPASVTHSDSAVRITSDLIETLHPYLEPWSEDVLKGVPVFAALEGGRAVAVCASVRLAARAHEAGVETHPSFRRRGYAARVTNAWAKAVTEADRLPLYSTAWENEASRMLARRLGLIQYGSVLHLA